MHVDRSSIGPGVSLVDRISVRIDEQRTVKVCSFFHGTLAVLFDLAAPEERLAIFIDRLQFQPYIEGIDGSTGEEVADLARSNDDIHAHVAAAPHRGRNEHKRRGNSASLAGGCALPRPTSFPATPAEHR